MAKFILYQSKANANWRWNLKAKNGEIVCWAEGYSSKQAAKDSIAFVKQYAARSPTDEI